MEQIIQNDPTLKMFIEEPIEAQTGEVFIEGEKIDSWQYCNLSFLERLNFKDLNC